MAKFSGQPALDQRLVPDEEANAFFTTAVSFCQLQVSEPSLQRADFDLSTGGFPAEADKFFGANIIGGPTG